MSLEMNTFTTQSTVAGWSSPVARRAHNPKVVGSNPAPATIFGHTRFVQLIEITS